jgi:glucose-6-phosphate isomerase
MTPLRERAAWRALERHAREIAPRHLRDLFAEDPGRGERLVAEAAGLVLDYSKHRITDETLTLLAQLARESGLAERIDALFRGEPVNTTEGRPALHVALRMPRERSLVVGGVDVVAEVHAELDRMAAFCERVRVGEWRGHTGKAIRSVLNIGIGGSDLGPAMAYEALRRYARPDLVVRFLSNVDPAAFVEATRDLDPQTTLVIVSSKTFTTLETMANARAARSWLLDALGEEQALAQHLVAVTANPGEAARFGIGAECVFRFWDWVGGRYSLASAIGLSTMLAIGPERFAELRAGLHAMDEHFRATPPRESLPALLGLLGVWYGGFLGAHAHAVVPYTAALARFPAYLQQLSMESLGKSATLDGRRVDYETGPVVFGEPGTNSQHSFFQLLHQGTRLVPVDLIGFLHSLDPVADHQELLLASLFAQAEALAFGETAEELRAAGVSEELIAHRTCEGNRPSSVILGDRLTPQTLGALVALYEHAVFTQATVWGIDPFDQWGVELGKTLAQRIVPELRDAVEPELAHDSSTNALIRRYRSARESEPRGGA